MLKICKAAKVWISHLIYLVPCGNEAAMANVYMRILHCLAGGGINTIRNPLKYGIIGNNLQYKSPCHPNVLIDECISHHFPATLQRLAANERQATNEGRNWI
jgi:hypothetical protein